MINRIIFFISAILFLNACDTSEKGLSFQELKTEIENQKDSSVIHLREKNGTWALVNFLRDDSCFYVKRRMIIVLDSLQKDRIFSEVKNYSANENILFGGSSLVIQYENDVVFGLDFLNNFLFKILKLDPDTKFELEKVKKDNCKYKENEIPTPPAK